MTSRTTQLALLAARSGQPAARTTQVAVLVAYAPPATRVVRTSQMAALVALNSSGAIMPRTTQMAVLVAYKTGTPGALSTRAWTFDFDGHTFYVLDLAEEGCFVYDITTAKWAKFETEGYDTWNMLRGIVWNNRVVAADVSNPIVWALDPTNTLDEDWRPVQHVVSGKIESRARVARQQDSLRIAASVGKVGVDGAEIRLRVSDDNGNTWFSLEPIALTSGDYSQDIEWRSLGAIQAPGRVFELSDEGGLVRLDGANADVAGLGDAND